MKYERNCFSENRKPELLESMGIEYKLSGTDKFP